MSTSYAPGDIANGHILNSDGTWTPVAAAPTKPKSKGVVIAAILAVAVAIGGVGVAIAANASTPTSSGTSVTQLVDASGMSADEAQFILDNEADYGDMDASTEVAYVDLGWTVCTSLDNGTSVGTVGDILMSNGFSADEAASTVIGSAYNLCPTHIDTLDAYIDAGSPSV